MLASHSLSSTPSSSALTIPPKSALLAKSSFHGLRLPSINPSSSLRLRAQASPSSTVVMMAKREEELKELRAKSNEELNEEILQLKGELFMLRLQRSARENFKPSDFGRMRKRVARMLTVKREREIEQGVGKRLSRKLDKEWKRSIVVRPPPSLKKLQEEKAAAEAEKS
ncbi:50S ribosomal protein L29, chloroplastic [Chenopodium quinoa]|uniref:Large ribosomal subunit protein uL29c n=1 Tax=Chenopodium quinoa TaxID=63459 RepID=A0A803KXP4_CHEQI|nr:50S ribosomal protein L29, chloroplastic [Chenopodium quinoa]